MTPVLQKRFSFADVGTGRPLCDVKAAMFLLDRDEDGVLHLIEDGQLEFAFNVAMPGADARELRIWSGSIRKYVAAGIVNRLPADQVDDSVRAKSSKISTVDQVVADILPGMGVEITAVALKRAFNCSSTHVHNLIGAGALEEIAHADRKQTNTRWVARESAIRFLKTRRVQ